MITINAAKMKTLAQMVHEANKVFCMANGDDSQEHWNEAPDYNHQSAMVGVKALFVNPDLTPEESHDVWMETKKKDGWVYGKIKDRDKKTHPSLIPYNELSAVEKYKDDIVQSIVKSYINFIGRDNYTIDPAIA